MRSRNRHFFAMAIALWSYLGVGAVAADVKVIANPSVKVSSVSPEDLKGVFLETKTALADGSRVQPVVLKSGSVHQAFVRQFIGKTDTALEMYYRSLVFTGKGLMPKALDSDIEVINYVAKTKGAVGYVSATASATGVKTLEVQ